MNDIKNILASGERVTLECKKAQRSVPNSLWDTYSAFANTYGGTILLGIVEHTEEQDKSKRFEIAGVEDADKIRKDLWNTINSKEKVNVNLLRDEDVQAIDIEGKTVVAVNVPRAESSMRPIYINNNLSRGTFKRNHEGDYHCTEQELKMMLRDANEAGNDRMILEYYTMDDIDIPTLEGYRIMFKTDNPDHVWNSLDHKEFLMQLGGYAIDRKERIEGLTMAGLLMFGKGLPIRDRFDNLRMDYIDKSHLVGDQRYSDRLTYDGRWENNLYNFVRMVLPKLTIDLPRPFRMEGIIRKDDTLQHKAVREAVTNMIIHSDLMLNGILRIEKYDDRIVLTNPGLLKLPIEQIYQGGESKARNQRMQNMFRMITTASGRSSHMPRHRPRHGDGGSGHNRNRRLRYGADGWAGVYPTGDGKHDRCSGTHSRDSPSDRLERPLSGSLHRMDYCGRPGAALRSWERSAARHPERARHLRPPAW